MKMKKLLALLLALVMSMALASCTSTSGGSSSDTASSDTATSDTTSSDTAATSDFTWNQNKEVWSVLPTTNAEGLISINDAMGAKLEDQGWTYVKKDAEGDPAAQVTYFEDAISSGKVGAIMCAAMAVDMLKDVAQEAIDAGIVVVYLGAVPTDYTINGAVYTAYELTGYYAILMVEEWANQNIDNLAKNEDGKVPVALDVYDDIQDGQYRSNAFRDRTAESDILYVYNTNVSYGSDATTKGYAWAENMMNANPDLRIFVCYEPDCMAGVISYLNSYCTEKGLDPADFCVVNTYEDTVTTEELAKAEADASSTVFKGYVTYGDAPSATGETLADLILGATDGTWAFGDIYYDSIHSYNNFGFVGEWKMGDENPAEKYKY